VGHESNGFRASPPGFPKRPNFLNYSGFTKWEENVISTRIFYF
jgi:hypothetical protein